MYFAGNSLGIRRWREGTVHRGGQQAVWLAWLLGPDEDAGAVTIFFVEDQTRTAANEVVDRQADPLGVDVDVDPFVVEEREMPRRHQAQQPERDRHPHQLARVVVIGQDAQRLDRLARRRGRNLIAVHDRVV